MFRRVCVLLLLTTALAMGRQPFVATLQGTSADGKLLVSTGQSDVLVDLAGVSVPPKALPAFRGYIQKVCGGHRLAVHPEEVLEESAVRRHYQATVVVVTGSGKQICLNKQLLVDGYALASGRWEEYQEKGKARQVGLWSVGQPRWVVPKIPRTAPVASAEGTDRDRIIQMYGMPDFTRRDTEKDTHDVIGHHIMIRDFYVKQGLVFIYRDGRLLNQQPYVER